MTWRFVIHEIFHAVRLIKILIFSALVSQKRTILAIKVRGHELAVLPEVTSSKLASQ
jgi:hypothetical protein